MLCVFRLLEPGASREGSRRQKEKGLDSGGRRRRGESGSCALACAGPRLVVGSLPFLRGWADPVTLELIRPFRLDFRLDTSPLVRGH